MGNCKYCGQKAGFLRRSHKDCDDAHKAGRQRMVALVADAAGQSHFSEAALLSDLEMIAAGSYIDDGIGVMRDAQTAKPQEFRTSDGWFIYNLVTNLARH